jgi:molybdenum cofactor cytidylyltransferase
MIDLAVILAAGGSRRMGKAKALLPWGSKTLLEAHIEALGAVAAEVLVVDGAENLGGYGAPRVRNANWASTWPADSLQLALRARPAAVTVLVTPVDTVPASPEVLAALLGTRTAVPVDPTGLPGHPVLIAGDVVARVRAAAPVGGLRTLLNTAERVEVASGWVSMDFDDPHTYARVREASIGD